ncbi:MAG: DOMON-like domain-containing protein [Ottowia sp.]|uniref:DOMON-like domain-containing protein n=1 Tax=Ottowia sp. TaxID=1898956 RepID=UPI0039E41736
MPATPRTFTLQCHPATPCAALAAAAVSVAPAPGGGWRLAFTLAGDMARLRIPAPAARPAAADGLWRHTCLEAFVGDPQGPRYHEFNFSPSGDWAAYAFAAERQRAPATAPLPPPRIACTQDARSLRLDAWLPPAYSGWQMGLAAVIESADGSLSYFALAHPRAVPDFHQRAGWTTHLPTLA